ncbi:MAG: hypothetical protein IJ512_05230 [Ruminococcus sp.]|nr:hypothetical protein [Ruminococcus sp.]
MRNFLKKTAASLLSAVMLGSALPVWSAAAEEYYEDTPVDPADSFLVDEADMLTEEQEAELTEEILETAAYIDMNILVFVSGHHESRSWTQMYCEGLCGEAFGLEDDSIVMYLDLSGHDDPSYSPYDFFYTRNRARFYYTDDAYGGGNRVQDIFSEMNHYLPRNNEDVEGAVYEFLLQLELYYDVGPDLDYYYYIADTDRYVTMESDGTLVHSDSEPKEWGMAILIGIVGALIITLITFFGIKHHYRFKSAPSSLHYLDFSTASFGPRSDVFIRKYQTRRKIERSSGGGGGGGGTRSGGGGGGNSR